MPLRNDIKKVLVIGSGPIIIGQAAEFDYAGTQACRALKSAGLEVVLINSNPATIMTDNKMADEIYIEPLTLPIIKRIIQKEKPDSILSTLGGQTGLTLSMQLAKEGFLEENNVKLLGANPLTIDKAEDRQMFKDMMEKIGEPTIPSKVVTDLENAISFANEIGYPLIIRPAFTLGGTGGGIVQNEEELIEIATNGLRLSPITQILVEKCISGWKEIEFEVIRDSIGNVITVCSMENFDPVGVHTGDSIVIAPAVTLSDKEYQMLRSSSLKIVEELKIEGGCNCQFALNTDSFEYAVIEVNPRVSRSSALASKATGYPIAKVATKIAVGYTLDEIQNEVTGVTYACFEPALDYVVVKFPKWPFDKFVYAKKDLGTQMKATGEVMAIGASFEEAILKAVRGAEISHDFLTDAHCSSLSYDEIYEQLNRCDDKRIFAVYEALRRGITPKEINEITKIDVWFLYKLKNIVITQNNLETQELTDELYITAKKQGFLDSVIENLSNKKIKNKKWATYKMVDTCAGEFKATTPYFYSSYLDDNEAKHFILENKSDKKTIIVFGSGPIRIGQGIEFDYASVHCVWSLREKGYEVVIVNNNPETVSTDFDTADRLYFEPLTKEDVMNVIHTENPYGVVVAFGGGTAIKLTKFLYENNINILGTSADSIDMAEDRERFDELLEELHILRPKGETVLNESEALIAAEKIGYPVLLRPSYVLGGQNMIISYNEDDTKEYIKIILNGLDDNPILIDKYLSGVELEVDAISDGEDILIPGIMEHIERAGVHSGDSIAMYPAMNLTASMITKIVDCSKRLALSLNTKGLINIQYLVYGNELYVIEVNPRSSRTVPYISKVTKIPMIDLATKTMLGEKLRDLGYGTGLRKLSPYVAVKVPVFSFAKLSGVDTHLGPEMKSTGEVLGIGTCMEEALYKGLIGAGYKLCKNGGVLMSVRHNDQSEIGAVAKGFHELGYKIYATKGTGETISKLNIPVEIVENTIALVESGKVNFVVSTSKKGRIPSRDSVKLRRKSIERSIPCLTAIDTANAVIRSIKGKYSEQSVEIVDINNMRDEKEKCKFIKMQSCGNDYIYFNCMEKDLENPEALSIRLSDRHFGIGGDGIVLICKSEIADAKMKMYNLDGSEGQMSGNAIRCIATYLYDNNIVHNEIIRIETQSGVKNVKIFEREGKAMDAQVDMGNAILRAKDIPVISNKEMVINEKINVNGTDYNITCLSMGNPHCVVFVQNVDFIDVKTIGSIFENLSIFPQRANIEFVSIVDKTTLRAGIWERGNGETMACGTGACAAVVASVLNGYCDKNEEITVKLLGGDMIVKYTDDDILLMGKSIMVYEGEIEI